jgi:hypothetical protein
MADLKAFAEQLVNLTVKEVNELATILKEEYGIEPAAAAVAVAAGPAAGAAAAEEKTSFDVVLKSAGAAKLQVVKAVKEACDLYDVVTDLLCIGISRFMNGFPMVASEVDKGAQPWDVFQILSVSGHQTVGIASITKVIRGEGRDDD